MFGDGRGQFKVVRNARGQMSLWPAGRPNAAGWDDTGIVGTKERCLTYTAEEWHDLRPTDVTRPHDGHTAPVDTPGAPA